jgi:peptidoglycan L-alanyl-D-glutamate endopeptidase CwlK
MGFAFGKRSKEEISTMHNDLQKVFNLAIKRTKVDFGITEGHRSVKRQQYLFQMGRSKIDGVTKLGKHNLKPAEAGDIYIYHPDLETRRKLAYNREHLSYVAGVIDSCAEELFEAGEISHKIRWGANWDSDGIIALDHNFDDYPHHELINA